MKKIFLAVVFVCCMFALSACGGANANSNSNKQEQEAKSATATPLTYVSNNKEELYTSNVVETKEGVTICCTPNYIVGPEAQGQFLFMLNETAHEAGEDVKFTSKGLYQIDFYDYKGSLIASEKCNETATVGEYYYRQEQNQERQTYIDKVILYIEHDGNLYSAEFVRSGA